jgi:chemotaxis protein MotB
MSATGYSSTRPMVPESDPGAITLNRRVDIVVLSTASAEANELLPGIAAGTAPAGSTSTTTDTTTTSEGGHP